MRAHAARRRHFANVLKMVRQAPTFLHTRRPAAVYSSKRPCLKAVHTRPSGLPATAVSAPALSLALRAGRSSSASASPAARSTSVTQLVLIRSMCNSR